MRKVLLTLASISALGALAACADAPTAAPRAPEAPSQLLGLPLTEPLDPLTAPLEGTLEKLGVPLVSTALRRTTALPSDITVSATISGDGGVIAIPAAGLRVEFPRGAIVGEPVKVTARAVAGRLVAYEFEPHGIRFARPVRMTQELRGTEWLKVNPLFLKAVYFESDSDLDVANGLVRVAEVLPATLNVLSGRLSFNVEHFSGYAVSTGRAVAQE